MKNEKYEFSLNPRIQQGMLRHWSLQTQLPWEVQHKDPNSRRSFEVRIEFHYGLDGPDHSRFELFEWIDGDSLEIQSPEEFKSDVEAVMDNEGLSRDEAEAAVLKTRRDSKTWEVPREEILRQAKITWEAIRLIVSPSLTY